MPNALLAALILYTRLPFGRIKQLPAESFSRATDWWPWVGFLTGGLLVGGALLGFALGVNSFVIALMAILMRLLCTGAFHEDGLADFFDGFGGGHSRERILEIMKDSHIGTYGVITLILYFLSFHHLIEHFTEALLFLWLADPLAKSTALSLVIGLPYARKAEAAKVQTVYNSPRGLRLALSLLPGIIAFCVLFALHGYCVLGGLMLMLLVMAFIFLLLHRKLGGYTGDCCGASFLLCESAFYVGTYFTEQIFF